MSTQREWNKENSTLIECKEMQAGRLLIDSACDGRCHHCHLISFSPRTFKLCSSAKSSLLFSWRGMTLHFHRSCSGKGLLYSRGRPAGFLTSPHSLFHGGQKRCVWGQCQESLRGCYPSACSDQHESCKTLLASGASPV